LIAFQNLHGAGQVGDQYSDFFRGLFRRKTAISAVLNPMSHIPFPQRPSKQTQQI